MAGWQDLVAPQGTAQSVQQTPTWQALASGPGMEPPQPKPVQPDSLNEYIEGGVPGSRQMSGAAAVANHETKRVANAVTTAFGGNAPYPDEEQKNAGDVYRDALAQHDARREAFVEQDLPKSPYLRIPLEGMLNLPGMIGSAGPAVGAMNLPATVAGRAIQAAKGGATMGGITGLDQSDLTKPVQSAVNTATGTVVGAGVGAGASLAADAVTPIADWIGRKMGGTAAVQSQAERMVTQRLQQDAKAGGPTAKDMIDLLDQAVPGTPQSILDVAGENTKALGGKLARQPGESRQYVIGTLNARDAGAQQRMVTGIDQNIAPQNAGSAYSTEQALMDSRANAARPLYEQAFKANQSIESPEVDRILNTPAGKAAFKSAITKMQNDRSLVGVADPELTEQAAEQGITTGRGVAAGLNLRTLDYVKRALDDQIGAAYRAGSNDDARIVIGLKNDLVKALDAADVTARAGPNSTKAAGGLYAQARAAYSGPSQSIDALNLGQEFLAKSPEQITAEISGLSPNDAEFYRLGAADTLRRNVMKTGAAGNEANALAKNPYVEQQTKSLFANQQDGENFFASVVRPEQRMFDTKYQVAGNSKTAARVAEDQGGNPSLLSGVYQVGHGLGTANPGAFMEGVANIGRSLGINARNPQVDLAAAKLLLNPDVIANRALILKAANARPPVSRIPLASLPAASLAARAYPALTSALSGTQSP